ncbi:MAG: DegQ family serine endoprotease [Verrucomicrobia bacterium]|nr:DegQ family serine endoprotease [Verrucomicrobiota bacterium]
MPYLVLGAALLVAGASAAVSKDDSKSEAKVTPVKLVVDDKPVTRDVKLGTSFSPIVKKVAPSVVMVTTSAKPKQAAMQEFPGFDNPFFRRFFGEEFDQRQQRRRPNAPRQVGQGSGVIVTKDGYILTNNHVVDGADEVKVGLQDGREFTGKVVGKDPKTDVAVLKIDGKDLPFIAMADSDKIEVGDIVLAVGNPFGIGQTVTMGMISATGRATLGLDYEDFIQTDAAINPGNSGGALVDADGRLIGINTAILSRSGGNQGIGFAIPMNLARDVMESLVADGKVTRGYLGVMIQDVTPSLAKEFNLKDQKGALIGDVVPKGPAEKAGLKSGDIVLEFNGKAVTGSRQLKLQVARVKPSESVPVKVLRNGSTKTLEVTVRELPGSEQVAKADNSSSADGEALKGVAVGDLDAQTRREMNVPANVHGAVVLDVEEGSAAREAGLKPGDVILEINRQPVKDAEDAVKLTENPKDKTTLLRIWSNGGSRYVVVDESSAG